MAIKGTDYTIDTDLRDSLVSDMETKTGSFSSAVGTSSGSFIGIQRAGMPGVTYKDPNIQGKVGITSDMITQVRIAYDTYIGEINQAINNLSNPEINQAFKGGSVERAFQSLVESVKKVAQDFTSSLQEAEMQIIQGVQRAYSAQDVAVGSDITGDAGTLS